MVFFFLCLEHPLRFHEYHSFTSFNSYICFVLAIMLRCQTYVYVFWRFLIKYAQKGTHDWEATKLYVGIALHSVKNKTGLSGFSRSTSILLATVNWNVWKVKETCLDVLTLGHIIFKMQEVRQVSFTIREKYKLKNKYVYFII